MSRTTATQIHNKRTTCPAAQRSTSVRAVRSCTRARAHGPRMRTSVHASVAQEAAMRDAQAHTAPTPSNGKPVTTKHVLLSASASTRSHCAQKQHNCKKTQNAPHCATLHPRRGRHRRRNLRTHWQPLQRLSSPTNLAAATPFLSLLCGAFLLHC
ncbi:hypothetical protein BC826DRAFT_1087984, partial [Russula brevipes]